MNDIAPKPTGEIVLYQTADGSMRIECRFANENVWLTQRLLAELYQIGVNTTNHHIKEILADGELTAEATIRQYRIVQTEGARTIERQVEHYSLEMILAVGYRVRSQRGAAFRQWATTQLKEYLVKGFVMDDERLEKPTSAATATEATKETQEIWSQRHEDASLVISVPLVSFQR